MLIFCTCSIIGEIQGGFFLQIIKRMHRKWYVLLAVVAMAVFCLANTPAMAAEEDFRVVGYYSATSFDEPLERLDMTQYTHIMYGFLKPQTDGSVLPVPKPELLQQVVEQAHAADVKVLLQWRMVLSE